MITEEKRRIDLHLPAGWNRCTTEELEYIAAAIISEQQRVDRYHPFDWTAVKVDIMIAINGLEVVGRVEETERQAEKPDSEASFILRFWKPSVWQRVRARIGRTSVQFHRHKDTGDFEMPVSYVHALCEQLNWINNEKSDKTIFLFPYPTLDIKSKMGKSRGIIHRPSSVIRLQGPPPLLDGYTWREYRLLSDWMQAYMRHTNARRNDAAAEAQREFLAVLFKPKAGDGRDNDISKYRDSDKIDAAIFEGFSPIKWQVILFWWSSLMSMLAKKFPKVFKQQPVGKSKRRPQQQDTPWDFYNRVTATIQKYIGGLSEQDVNNATYGTILQQLEMMAQESAEMEKIRKSHK